MSGKKKGKPGKGLKQLKKPPPKAKVPPKPYNMRSR